MKLSWKIWFVLVILVFGMFFALSARINADTSNTLGDAPTFTVSAPVEPVLSTAVRDLPPASREPMLNREVYMTWLGEGIGLEGPSIGLDPLVSRSVNDGFTPTPLVTFEGVPSISGVTPPDTNGDVGPDHYVQMTNFSFRIWDKGDPDNGIPPTPLIPPTLTGALFAPLGGQCTSNFGDPIVVYDDMADRWLLSQFGLSAPEGMCIAISQTPDPTGAYFLYFFPTPDFPDYPKLGVWPDAYYMGTNTGFPNQYYAFAFDRVSMLAGSPATVQSFGGLPNLMMPADVDGPLPPPAGDPGIFYTFYHPSGNGHPAGSERLAIYEFDVDWVTPTNSTYTLVQELPIAAFNYTICGFFAGGCIAQPGTGQLLDDIAWWPMFRFQYRNFDDYAAMVGNFTVDADGNNHAGIRWFEVRKTGSTYTLEQEGTHFPTSDSRWMGSIAMDGSGNIALGYSVSSSSVIPSIRYATRLLSDPPGTLSAEAEMWTGGGVQTSIHRWGDYSTMSVDPVDNCTFWYTTEYHDANDGGFNWNTRVGVFRIPECTGGLGPNFSMSLDPNALEICSPASASVDVNFSWLDGYSAPVTLNAVGVPSGYSAGFSVNPVVTPTVTSELSLTNVGAVTPGAYAVNIVGIGSPTPTHTATLQLTLFDAVPGAPTLVAPANGATNVDLRPTYQWTAASQAGSYYVEVADDAGFSNIVYTTTTNGTSHQPGTPLDPLTTYYWRVTASNACGAGATSSVFSFETRDIPPILLVDDDDNNPNVRGYYTDALDALGAEYDVWDTNNSDNEPSAAELAPYTAVIWFTGVEFGGSAGPGSAGETALASWLDNGGCFFISSQDYLFDRGQTTFMSNYLGMASGTSDVGQTTVTGAGSVYSGLGPYSLVYPFTNWSDIINPAGPPAELAFSGNQGNAAINKDTGVYRTTFWGFPWEAIPTAADREAALQTTLNWCGALGPTGTLAGTVTDLDSSLGIPGATITAVGPGTFMATTNSSGAYSRVLPVGTYDVTASAPNYVPVTVNNVVITDGATTVQDFQLQGSALTYSPASIEESMEIGDVVSNTVTVTNTGPLPIDWNVTIGNWSDPTALRIIPRTITTQDAPDFSQPAAIGPASVRSPQGRSTLASQPAIPFAWANGASMPSGVVRYAHTQCADQPDSYYVISGVDATFSVTNGAWRYDANTDSWATLAPIPTGQEGTAAVCYAGNIYVAGGGGTNQMFIYNIAANSWTTGAAVPRSVWGAAIGAWDGKVYLIGGDSDFTFGGTSNQVNIYDIASNTWTGTGVNMPTAAVTAGSVQAGQYVYVVGGWGDASPGSNINVTQRYDMSTNSWETGPTFTSARADLALALTASNLYAIAGDGNGGGAFDPVALVESLDHTAWPGGAWTNISDPLPTAVTAINGGFCTGAMAGGEIWAPGGFNGSAVANTNRYRPSESCFTDGTPWAYAVPDSGTIPANSTATFEVVFDATSLIEVGTYTAELSFTGTFVNVVPSMPLTMHLSCPTCGFLEGDITDSQTGDPVDASIQITNTGGFDVTVSGSSYSVAVQPGNYYISVEATGYLGQSDTAVVTAGATTVVDFALDPAIAILSYSPADIEEYMVLGDIVTNTVTVTNSGFVDLEFTVDIGGYGGPLLVQQVVPTYVPPAVTSSTANNLQQFATGETTTGLDLPTATLEALGLTVLLDQQPNQVNGLFSDSDCGLCGTGAQSIAENFSLASTETIGQIIFWNGYFPGDVPIDPDLITVIFHEDAGGFPGAVVSTESNVPYERVQTGVVLFGVHEWMHTLTLATPVTLGPGNYWVEIFNATIGSSENFFWETGNPDTIGNGLTGSAWSTSVPGSSWNFDGTTELAIQLVTGTAGPQWAYAVPDSGTVPANSTATFNVVFDSTVVTETGTYIADLTFSGNFVNIVPTMPLTMHLVLTGTYGLDMSGDMAASGEAGQTVAYTIWLTNTGNVVDTYNLMLSGNDWDATLSESSVTVSAYDSDSVTVWVDIPPDAMGNETDVVTVVATSVNDPTVTDSADMTTSVTAVYSMEMSGNMSGSGAPGSTVMYAITITNTGNVADTYNLSLGTHTWTAQLPGGNSVNVAAGASVTVMLHVNIPPNATHNQSDAVTVTVTSANDSSVTGSATMTTTAVVTSYTIYLPILMKP